MSRARPLSRCFAPSHEPLEARALNTQVFVFSGNGLAAAGTGLLTAWAAKDLRSQGFQPVQLAYPTMNTPAAFEAVAHEIKAISHGQPIGLMGFSAGGLLSLRLAAVPDLNVKAVLDYYGPPDLRNWLNAHQGEKSYRYVLAHAHPTPALINLFSGPGSTSARVVGAFGLNDKIASVAENSTSLQNDFPSAQVFTYDGPHGVAFDTSPAAVSAFDQQLSAP